MQEENDGINVIHFGEPEHIVISVTEQDIYVNFVNSLNGVDQSQK